MQMFHGKEHAAFLDEKILGFLKKRLINSALIPTLGILQIGDNPASKKYIDLKVNYCIKMGIPVETLFLDAFLSDEIIVSKVKEFISLSSIAGVIIQLPLPRPSLNLLVNLIPIEKDIDVLSDLAQRNFLFKEEAIKPPVVRALEYLLFSIHLNLENLECTIIGHGMLIGRSVSAFLLSRKAKMLVLDKTPSHDELYAKYYLGKDIKFVKEAFVKGKSLDSQLVILSAGVPKLVKGENLVQDGYVVDFGSSLVDGKTVGDLDLDSKLDHLGVVSPSPGGMGPLVIRFLIMNLLQI